MADTWKTISPEGVRAFAYGATTVLLIWLVAEGYLQPAMNLLMILGLSPLFSKSIFIGTIIFLLLIIIFYGLHGMFFTSLMMMHMPWVTNPDKFLFFFWLWITAIISCIFNVFEVNVLYQFLSLFFVFLIPSLYLGIKIQKVGGNE